MPLGTEDGDPACTTLTREGAGPWPNGKFFLELLAEFRPRRNLDSIQNTPHRSCLNFSPKHRVGWLGFQVGWGQLARGLLCRSLPLLARGTLLPTFRSG